MRIPDDSEMKQLLQVISPSSPFGSRDVAMINLALNTGLRVAELTGLDVKHVWFKEAPHTLLDLPPDICKYNRSRQIPLNTAAREAITQLVRFLRMRGFSSHPDAPLLTDRRHKRLPPREVQRCMQVYREKAGLALRVTPHTLRHAFASRLTQTGATPYEVKELLGHRELRTSHIYVFNQPRKLAATVERLTPKLVVSKYPSGYIAIAA
jgi:site-specific recombinase XerD